MAKWVLSVVMLVLGVLPFVNWFAYWRSSDWVAVDGTITCLEARNTAHKEDVPPESGHCCALECEYSYEFEGEAYTNDRVGAEVFGNPRTRSDRYRVLKESQRQDGVVEVLVNPDDPAESALFWGPAFTLDMFFGPALAVIYFGWLALSGPRPVKEKIALLGWSFKRNGKKLRKLLRPSVGGTEGR